MPNKYATTAIFLVVISAVLFAIALLSDLGDFTNAAFVISGMVCVMIGIFTLTFSMGEPVDPHLVGILPSQGSMNFCSVTHYLDIHGKAYFLPSPYTGETRVMQFNPISTYDGRQGSTKGSFKESGPPGIVTPPACDLLIQDLKKKNALVIPDNEEELSCLLRETIEDFFNFAPRVSVQWEGNTVTVTFHKFPYSDGCKIIAQKSQTCCTMSPCPACSLCGALIAEGKNQVVSLERCSVDPSSNDVTAVFSLLPSPESNA
jgi:hypothetical protein